MKSSIEPSQAAALQDLLIAQVDIAKNTVDGVLSGKHKGDAFYCASLQLEAIKATAVALKLAAPQPTINHAIYTQEYFYTKLYEAADSQIISIGLTLSSVLSRITGDTLAGLRAGKPTKKQLINLLGDICLEIGVMHRLIIIIQFAHRCIGVSPNSTTKSYVESLCLDSIKTHKGGAE
jgi:hypothetical protein